MNYQYANDVPVLRRPLNAVAPQNAVLYAECDVVSNSPHDRCFVCGSPSLFNIAHLFGGKLPRDWATLIERQTRESRTAELVLAFPRTHRVRRITLDSGEFHVFTSMFDAIAWLGLEVTLLLPASTHDTLRMRTEEPDSQNSATNIPPSVPKTLRGAKRKGVGE